MSMQIALQKSEVKNILRGIFFLPAHLCFFVFICGFVFFSFSEASASDYPSWWTNRGIINNAAALNDYAAVNQGQLKWVVTNACEELKANLSGGAGPDVENVIRSVTLNNNYCAVIRLFKAVETTGDWMYIKDINIAHAQITGSFANAIQDEVGLQILEPRYGSSDFVIRTAFWMDLPAGSDKAYLLFEGVSEGKGDLVPVVLDASGNVLAEEGSVSIELRDIERLYDRAHSTPAEASFSYPYNQMPGSCVSPFYLTGTGGVEIDINKLSFHSGFDEGTELSFEPAPDEENKCVVFVHGVALSCPEVRCYTSSFYKRLWWEGYKGRVVAFRWSTPIPDFDPWGFDDGEFHSWSCAHGLMNYVSDLKTKMPGATISVLGHSLGNACVGAALLDGMTVDSYVMMEAAVALSAYYSNAVPTESYSPRLTRVNTGAAPDNISDQGYRSYLFNIRPNITGNWVSYRNQNDYWLETGHFTRVFAGRECNWERDQEGKPDGFVALYFYDITRDSGSRCRNGPIDSSRPVEDDKEALAYVAQSQTRAVGAESANPTPPRADGNVDLSAYGFGGARIDHSGQFQRDIQLMYSDAYGTPYLISLYRRLLRDLNLVT